MMPLLRVKSLCKTFQLQNGGEVTALSDITVDIEDGEFVSVVGPSGCGKSTMLRIIAGLTPLTSGSIELRGKPVSGPRADIGVVFQDSVLLPWLNIIENITIPARVQKKDRKQRLARARELLRDIAHLSDFERAYPKELSGGMKQRVAICRALINDPDILLMDEPFGALDAMTRERMNSALQEIWSKSRKTVFFITHSVNEAIFLGDRVLVMSARPGQVVLDLKIDLPRPRTVETMTSAPFGEFSRIAREALNARGEID